MRALIAIVALLALAAGGLYWARPDLARDLLMSARGAATGAGAAAKAQQAGQKGGQQGASIAVEVVEARQARTSVDIRAVGSLLSDETVQLAPEIAGRISEIVFEEGRKVKQGDVIIKLDDALVAAEVAQAKARLTLAEANNDRAKALSRTGNVTERSRDEAISSFETSKAELELAQARLSKHVLRAPFDGTAGVRAVSVGAYVGAGTPIVNIEKIDSLKVDFKVPEIHLGDVRVGQDIEVSVDALPGKSFKGQIYAINPMVDVNGRALSVRGRISNTELTLRPGLFARLLVKGLSETDVVLVPESAILPRGGDNFVFRVDDGKAVESRVRLGGRRNGEVEVVEGLAAQSTVVTAGQQRRRGGAKVETSARVQPPSSEQPPAGKPAMPLPGRRSDVREPLAAGSGRSG